MTAKVAIIFLEYAVFGFKFLVRWLSPEKPKALFIVGAGEHTSLAQRREGLRLFLARLLDCRLG